MVNISLLTKKWSSRCGADDLDDENAEAHQLLDDGQDEISRRQSPSSSRRSRLGSQVLTFVLGFLLCGLGILFYNLIRPSTTSSTMGHCGTSPAAARRLGCFFDPISFLWLPPACYDRDLVDEFLSLQDWEFRRELNATELIAIDEIMLGETSPVYVNMRYHVLHCTFQWKRMHKALQRGAIDSYIANYNHTKHCEEMLLDDDPGDTRNTVIRMKFVECQRLWS